MRRVLMVIPIMTFFTYTAIFLNIPIFRDIIVFIYLSFIPGFALLKFFKLKEISFLDAILFSVGLSIAFSMFTGLLVNELYVLLGFSQPLSTIPLIVAISAFALTIFFIEYRRDFSETLKWDKNLGGELKDVFPTSILLVLLPILSILGFLYYNVPIILLSCVIIAVLCIASVVSKRLVPENLFPLLIFSVSITLVCQVLLTSKYIVGYDVNLEYYVFRLTQINGHWSFLNTALNSVMTLNYNSMLSITLLPAVYSALMGAQGEIVFKILYPFIFCLVPLAMYRMFEKQFGKLIGLLSTFFFIFTSVAFYGVEPLSLNRQIVGELFFLLSVFLLINKAIPVSKRRLLLIVFGAALVVSHYALAFIFLAYVALTFIISRIKPKFDETVNGFTVLLLFVMTFSWYALGSGSLQTSLANTIKQASLGLITDSSSYHLGTAGTMYSVPQVFTIASWVNVAMLGIGNFFLIIGILLITLRPKGSGISPQYRVLSIMAAIILAASFFAPSIAVTLHFTRFYAITLLFLSPCFVLGGQTILVTLRKGWTKIKRLLKSQRSSRKTNIDRVFLLIAIILSAYFLSQVGFLNRVSESAIHSYNLDFDRLKTSNESQVVNSLLYIAYIPEQDVFSAVWLLNHKVATATVYADDESASHVLLSYGLMPNLLVPPITNTTIPIQGSFVYLGTLNVVNGLIPTSAGSFNTSEISPLLDKNDLIYSNGASEIWSSSQHS